MSVSSRVATTFEPARAGAMCATGARSTLAALWTVAASFAVAMAFPALAQDELPGRVGRVASVDGVLLHKAADDIADASEIGLNYPVAEGASLELAPGGRAEIDYGGGQFRLAGGAAVRVTRLTDRELELFAAKGSLVVRVRVYDADDSVRVDTPATQIALVRPGLYRIDVADDSPHTTVTVREGEALVAAGTGSVQVFPGQAAALFGVAGETADMRNAGAIDAFDAWNAARERMYDEPRQYTHVSPRMVGAADLASYGAWQTYPDYGAVWFPAGVSSEWAPYRYGHWTWLPGWGYAWVDDAPWGYAPFHYGRWAYIGGRWGWCPGAFVVRPVWAPALVAWYGGAGWLHAGLHGPVYGWVPLGWREPFVPWWGACTARCWSRYNRPHGVDAERRRHPGHAHFANWNAPGGVTAMRGDALTAGRPVAAHRVQVGANPAFTPSLVVARPPAIRPIAPVRPASTATASSPSTSHSARAPTHTLPQPQRARASPPAIAPPAAPSRIGALPAVAPPANRTSIAPVAPPASRGTDVPLRSVPRSERGARAAPPQPVAPAGSQVPAPVPAVAPRPVLPAPVAPVGASRSAASPAAPAPVPQQVVPSAPAPRSTIRAVAPPPGGVER